MSVTTEVTRDVNATRSIRLGLYLGLLAIFVLHQDLWLWHDDRLALGLPVGLTYHVLYCLAVTVLMALLVRLAWPALDQASGEVSEDDPA